MKSLTNRVGQLEKARDDLFRLGDAILFEMDDDLLTVIADGDDLTQTQIGEFDEIARRLSGGRFGASSFLTD